MYREFLRHLREGLGDRTAVTYNIDHLLKFEGRSVDKFKAWASVPFVASTDENVVLIYVQPTFDNLNRKQVLLEALFASFFARNSPENSRNYARFGCGFGCNNNNNNNLRPKTVHACILSLSLDSPVWTRIGDTRPEDPSVRQAVRDTMLHTRIDHTNRYSSTIFHRASTNDDGQWTSTSESGDCIRGAIERVRQTFGEDAPDYLTEALHRIEDAVDKKEEEYDDDDNDNDVMTSLSDVTRHLTKAELDRVARRRADKWLMLIK